MKLIKSTLLASALFGALGVVTPAFAQFGGTYDSQSWNLYYMQSLRPFAAKMQPADKKKVTDMEMAIVKMQANHGMTVMKMDADHKMAIAKMRRELHEFIVGGGAF